MGATEAGLESVKADQVHDEIMAAILGGHPQALQKGMNTQGHDKDH